MSYGSAVALQQAVFQLLDADATLDGLVGDAIFDEPPSGALPDTYVVLGQETAVDRSDKTGKGANHRFGVTVLSRDSGFAGAKAVAVAISDTLDGALPTLARGRVVYIRFERAVADRADAGRTRRIDLRFLARVDES